MTQDEMNELIDAAQQFSKSIEDLEKSRDQVEAARLHQTNSEAACAKTKTQFVALLRGHGISEIIINSKLYTLNYNGIIEQKRAPIILQEKIGIKQEKRSLEI